MDGYWGRILLVDLDKGKLSDEPLNERYARDFIGSTGLAARYLFDMIDASTEPLGGENPLILMPGLLNGTGAPSASRWGGATRSPYTGHYGDANCGALFGAELKNAGYDGIILIGKASQPVYIYIQDGLAELRDASNLWGKDTYATQEKIKKECNDRRVQIACIGPASENLVPFGNIMSEWGHALGRAGLGCVMGAKKVKAVAVRGRMRLPMRDRKRFREIALQAMKEVKDSFLSRWMHEGGTASWIDSAIAFGDGPTRYYTAGTMEEATNISGVTIMETCEIGHTGCFGCPIRCRKVLQLKDCKYVYDNIEGPEYETLIAWGPMLGIADLPTLVHMNKLINGYGFDSISSGASAGYAFYLYNLGVLSDKDTGGLRLTWGNIEAAIELIHQIGRKEGFGAVLAGGTRRMAQVYGRPLSEAAQTKGLEIPMHDPRAFHAMGLVYATAPRGADHNKSDAYAIDNGSGHPDLGLAPGDRWGDDKAEMVVISQNFSALTDSLGICHFAHIPFDLLIGMIDAATGWNIDRDWLMTTGERIFQLQRALSCKLGISAKDDLLPEIITRSIPDSGQEGHVPDMKKMLPEYYRLRDWDASTGKPSKRRLELLNMPEVAISIAAE